MDGILATVGIGLYEAQTASFVVAVLLVLADGASIEWGSGNVEVSVADELRHVAVEQCHQKCVDVRTIDVGIGHDDDLVVAQFLVVRLLAVFAKAKSYAQSLDDVVYLLVLECLVPHYTFNVEDLTADGQDGLEMTVTSLLGTAARRVTLDDEEFAVCCISVGAVGQFAGQTTASHGRLALYVLACLACSYTCCGCQNHLVHDDFRLVGVLLQVVAESFAYGLLDCTSHFAVAKLCLGLAFELGLCHLHADNGCQTFAEVLAGNLNMVLGKFLQFLHALFLGIALQCACQGGAETLKVSTTLYGVDVVYIGVQVLGITSVVHDGYLDGYSLLFGVQVDDIVDKACAGAVDVAYKVAQTTLAVENFLADAFYAGCLIDVQSHVGKGDVYAGIQVCQFAHTVGQDVVFVDGGSEYACIGPELLACASQVGFSNHAYWSVGLSLVIQLLVDLTVAEHL